MVTFPSNSTAISFRTRTPVKTSVAPILFNVSQPDDWQAFHPFVDQIRNMRMWTNGQDDLVGDEIDANGWPQKIPTGKTAIYFHVTFGPQWAQDFEVEFHSDRELVIGAQGNWTAGATTWDSETGINSATITYNASGGATELLLSLPGGGSGDINVTVGHMFPTAAYSDGTYARDLWNAGKYINPEYAEAFRIGVRRKSPKCLRFMVVNAINNNVAAYDTADLPTIQKQQWKSNFPPEAIAELVNSVGSPYSWNCYPLFSTSAYRQAHMNSLNTSTAASVVPVAQLGNELWNYGFDHVDVMLANAIKRYAIAGTSNSYLASGVSMVRDDPNNTVIVTLNEGDWTAAQANGVTINSPLVINGEDQANRINSVTGSDTAMDPTVLTIASPAYAAIEGADGTYDVYFGAYDMRPSYTAELQELLYHDAVAVYGAGNFLFVMDGYIGGDDEVQDLFEAPYWQAADPTGYAARSAVYDIYSPATYYGSGIDTDPMVKTWSTGDTEAALTALQTAILDSVSSRYEDFGDNSALKRIRDQLDIYAPGIRMWAYEGGQHIQTSASQQSYTSNNAVLVKNDGAGTATLTLAAGQWAQFTNRRYDETYNITITGEDHSNTITAISGSDTAGDPTVLTLVNSGDETITQADGTYSVYIEGALPLIVAWNEREDLTYPVLRNWWLWTMPYVPECNSNFRLMTELDDGNGIWGVKKTLTELTKYGEQVFKWADATS